MSEQITYAWGASSLGEFIAAASRSGLVAFEFADDRERALATIRQRLPHAIIREDSRELAGLIGSLSRAIDDPRTDPAIPLDPRGGDYEREVWRMLRDIPAGETTTYGALAAKLGTRDARDVTAAIAANGIAILIPCHRVIRKDGSLAGYRWGYRRKRMLLERERTA